MRPGDRTQVPTLAEAVARAAAICDPDREDGSVTAFVESFEDDERPATAVDDLADVLHSTRRGIDPNGDSAALAMTVATTVWLSTNPDQTEERQHVLHEAARLGFDDGPPDQVRGWLQERGAT